MDREVRLLSRSDDVETQARLLHNRVRAGEIKQVNIDFAAFMGHEAARNLSSEKYTFTLESWVEESRHAQRQWKKYIRLFGKFPTLISTYGALSSICKNSLSAAHTNHHGPDFNFTLGWVDRAAKILARLINNRASNKEVSSAAYPALCVESIFIHNFIWWMESVHVNILLLLANRYRAQSRREVGWDHIVISFQIMSRISSYLQINEMPQVNDLLISWVLDPKGFKI